jgi:hypothetical protein
LISRGGADRRRQKNQLTLPAEVVRDANIGPGDYFDVESTADGSFPRFPRRGLTPADLGNNIALPARSRRADAGA